MRALHQKLGTKTKCIYYIPEDVKQMKQDNRYRNVSVVPKTRTVWQEAGCLNKLVLLFHSTDVTENICSTTGCFPAPPPFTAVCGHLTSSHKGMWTEHMWHFLAKGLVSIVCSSHYFPFHGLHTVGSKVVRGGRATRQ